MKVKTIPIAVDMARQLITDWHKEHTIGIYMSANLELIRAEVIAMGTLTGSLVHPREVFKPALLHNAAMLVILHNHPSNDVKPSKNDIVLSRDLYKAGQLMGIPIQDSVVFNVFGDYYSLSAEGKLYKKEKGSS